MIRYDVLWNDLKDSVTQLYSNAVASANFFKNDDKERRIHEEIASRCAAVLASNVRLFREMVENGQDAAERKHDASGDPAGAEEAEQGEGGRRWNQRP